MLKYIHTEKIIQQQKVNFIELGFDEYTDDFLNWALMNRDNLEFIRACRIFDKASQQSVLHHDHLKMVMEIDDVVKHKRT